MPKHVLSHIETEPKSTFYGLYSSEEFYYLILLLNEKLGIKLKRSQKDISFKNSATAFMAYYHVDKKNDFEMFVYKNSLSSKTETKEGEGLFFQESKEHLLLPELGSVDFILKIECDQSIFVELLEKIRTIKEVVSVFKISEKKLKSKENLIFEY